MGFVGRFREDLQGFQGVSDEILSFLDIFNEFSMIFLFYCSQCSKMVGYGGIWKDIVGYSRICLDMLGYTNIC